MKKHLFIITLIATSFTNCGSNSTEEKELELRERELALKEKELELELIKSDNSITQEKPVKEAPLKTHYKPKNKSEKELKQELYLRECSRAAELLSGSLNVTPKYKNALSMKVNRLKINCTIRNKATVTTFKNIKARADFKSKTGAIILSKTFIIYEYISPKRSITYDNTFEITNQQYKDMSNYSWTILDAKCN